LKSEPIFISNIYHSGLGLHDDAFHNVGDDDDDGDDVVHHPKTQDRNS
jgi:hypothetical protein